MPKLVKDETKVEGTPGSLTIAEPDKPKPLRQSEIIRALLNRGASATGERGSVEITRNAQGKPQYKVVVYDDDPHVAMQRAHELYLMLDTFLPYEAANRK